MSRFSSEIECSSTAEVPRMQAVSHHDLHNARGFDTIDFMALLVLGWRSGR